MAEWRGLPSGYTQLEYIESSGTQYIDTGFMPNQDTRIVMDAQFVSGAASQFLFGTRTSSYGVNYSIFISTGGLRSGYGNSTETFASLTYTQRYVFDKNKERCSVGTAQVTNASNIFQSALNLYLLACDEGGTAKYFGTVRIYAAQIYDNGVLIRDFVPCTITTGEAGLYDMVNGVFYVNAGTGLFAVGDVVAAPEEPALPEEPEEPLEPDEPADWITPKTTWTAQDWFNIEDYRRITGNIRFLHAYAQTLWPAFELGGTVAVELGQIPTPNLHNRVEDDIQRLADNTFRLADFEDGKLFIINRPAWDWKDLNRIESNLLKLYYMLTGQDRNRRRLAFELGGVQFG